jgi:uncharacterized protein
LDFTLTLVLTHACDLACAYCSAGPKDGRRLDEALGRRAIERAVASLGAGGRLDLGFFGGEPLLEWPLARRLLRFARERAEVFASLTTNGTHLSERVARELLEDEVDVTVSIDGLPEVHDAERRLAGGRGSFEAARAAFERLAALDRPPRVLSVVRPRNVSRLVEGIRSLVALGATVFRPSLDFHARWSLEDVKVLEEAVAGLGELYAESFPQVSIGWLDTKVALLTGALPAPIACGFGRGEIALAPSGRLYPCERLVQDDRSERFVIGHVNEGEGAFARHPARCAPGDSACGGCAARPFCSNACACANLARTGFADRPDGLVCALEQACLLASRRVLERVTTRAA